MQNTKTQDVRSVWRDTYLLQYHMLPAYFTHTLAHKILLIGKSINFIRLCLQKLPRGSGREAENGDKKSNKVRKSLRGVNKSKSVGKYGIIQTAEDEVEEVEKEVERSADKEEDVGAQLQLMLPSADDQQGEHYSITTVYAELHIYTVLVYAAIVVVLYQYYGVHIFLSAVYIMHILYLYILPSPL